MPALKEIGNIASRLKDSPLSQSPLWNMPVEEIAPVQLFSFRSRLAIDGRLKEADEAIKIALDEVMNAATGGDIQLVEMLDYFEPHVSIITAGELRRGFMSMVRPRPAALLFGLEAKLSAQEVVTLTWDKVRTMRRSGLIPPYACRILDSQPVHIKCQYVFWRSVNGRPVPLFGLEQEVFDVFGMVWGELASAYERIILVDEKAEFSRWQELLWMVG